MIVLDWETTGLCLPFVAPLEEQPHAIELAALKLDDETLEIKDKLDFLIKPIDANGTQIPLTAEIMRITSLTDEMLVDQLPFVERYQTLVDFFLGERFMVAHNCAFERNIMFFELKRLGLGTKFPWPPVHICTVEKSMDEKGYRLKLAELHEIATGKPHINGAHRAMNDVLALYEAVKYLRDKAKL